MDPDYPYWICSDCGHRHGKWKSEHHLATFHDDICGWCGKFKSVTEPRDFSYPPYVPDHDEREEDRHA